MVSVCCVLNMRQIHADFIFYADLLRVFFCITIMRILECNVIHFHWYNAIMWNLNSFNLSSVSWVYCFNRTLPFFPVKVVLRDWAHGRMRAAVVCVVQGPVVWLRELSLSLVPFSCSLLHLCCRSVCWSFIAAHSLCTWVRQGKLWRLRRALQNKMKVVCVQAVPPSFTCVGVRKL